MQRYHYRMEKQWLDLPDGCLLGCSFPLLVPLLLLPWSTAWFWRCFKKKSILYQHQAHTDFNTEDYAVPEFTCCWVWNCIRLRYCWYGLTKLVGWFGFCMTKEEPLTGLAELLFGGMILDCSAPENCCCCIWWNGVGMGNLEPRWGPAPAIGKEPPGMVFGKGIIGQFMPMAIAAALCGCGGMYCWTPGNIIGTMLHPMDIVYIQHRQKIIGTHLEWNIINTRRKPSKGYMKIEQQE